MAALTTVKAACATVRIGAWVLRGKEGSGSADLERESGDKDKVVAVRLD